MPYEIGKGWVPEQSTQSSSSWNDVTNSSRNLFTGTPQDSYNSGSTDTGLNSAGQQAVGSAIGTAAQVGSQVIQGVTQYNQNESAREEARAMADQRLKDEQKQQNVSNTMRRQQQEIEEKSIALKKRRNDFDMKISSFIANIKKDQEDRVSLTTNLDGIFGSMKENEAIKNMIVGFSKGQV